MIADPILLSIAMIAVFALIVGGVFAIVRRGDRKRGILMLIAGVVLLGNVLIWAWPMPAVPGKSTPAHSLNASF